jgi:peptidoglycan/LPS O-acetylase OafA/YrhL
MSLRPGVRRTLLAVATLFLLVLAWQALAGALRQIPRSRSFGQQLEVGVQLACGLLSLLCVLTAFRWRRWSRAVLTSWTISLVATAALSALVWGPPSPAVSAAFAVLALLVALAVGRLLRIGVGA